MTASAREIIVIGASAGGVEALRTVVSALPSDMPAAIFIVMHIPAWHESALPPILSRCSSIPAVHPRSGDPVEHSRIYVAPPDQHLIMDSSNQVQLWHGPKENGFRPSINALFRSAAVTFGARVTGVVLTGGLDDGATGLWWIKRMGGAVVVQAHERALWAAIVALVAGVGPYLPQSFAIRSNQKQNESSIRQGKFERSCISLRRSGPMDRCPDRSSNVSTCECV